MVSILKKSRPQKIVNNNYVEKLMCIVCQGCLMLGCVLMIFRSFCLCQIHIICISLSSLIGSTLYGFFRLLLFMLVVPTHLQRHSIVRNQSLSFSLSLSFPLFRSFSMWLLVLSNVDRSQSLYASIEKKTSQQLNATSNFFLQLFPHDFSVQCKCIHAYTTQTHTY